jgi:hypothetical protein
LNRSERLLVWLMTRKAVWLSPFVPANVGTQNPKVRIFPWPWVPAYAGTNGESQTALRVINHTKSLSERFNLSGFVSLHGA